MLQEAPFLSSEAAESTPASVCVEQIYSVDLTAFCVCVAFLFSTRSFCVHFNVGQRDRSCRRAGRWTTNAVLTVFRVSPTRPTVATPLGFCPGEDEEQVMF